MQQISVTAQRQPTSSTPNRDINIPSPQSQKAWTRKSFTFTQLASGVRHGYMDFTQQFGGMPELLKRQIDRLESAIELSTDWLEIQYLMVELDQLKSLYEEMKSEAA